MVDNDRVYDFLAGLNKDLDEVCGPLLGMRPLAQIEEIFAEVCREESREGLDKKRSLPQIGMCMLMKNIRKKSWIIYHFVLLIIYALHLFTNLMNNLILSKNS